jgi:quercetin dioxygenase-like cupin family protein
MNALTPKINLIKTLSFDPEFSYSQLLEINLIFDGERRRILEIQITGGDKLKRHRATEPITVVCLSGNGTFYAGEDLEESIELVPGSLITLEPNIQHEIEAQPNIRLLLTKYT